MTHQPQPFLDSSLVGGFNPSEKYESQLGLLFPIYGKIKFMFQTTNQFSLHPMSFNVNRCISLDGQSVDSFGSNQRYGASLGLPPYYKQTLVNHS
jgi:hypothetical protein